MLTLYAHPFSSYCQKVLIALYENGTPFTFRSINLGDPKEADELTRIWPFRRFPVLVDQGKPVAESSIIIEHLQAFHPGPMRLIPADTAAALDVRFMDRIFDNDVMTPMTRIVLDALRPVDRRDHHGVAEARTLLERSYRWLDERMQSRTWACGEAFTLADCAAAPALFYADWTHAIPADLAALKAYRQRLLARPSFARAVEEARPFRQFFPLGAPDRD